jgi:hypothetical protein
MGIRAGKGCKAECKAEERAFAGLRDDKCAVETVYSTTFLRNAALQEYHKNQEGAPGG